MRPYVGVGFNQVFLIREEIVSIDNFSKQVLTLTEKDFSLSQFELILASEYISDATSNLIVQAYSVFYYNITKTKILSDFGFYFGLKLGYLF